MMRAFAKIAIAVTFVSAIVWFAEDGRMMRAFAKIAIAVTFVSAIVWFGHHSHPHNYGYAALHDAGW